jgi:hypothetical protein
MTCRNNHVDRYNNPLSDPGKDTSKGNQEQTWPQLSVTTAIKMDTSLEIVDSRNDSNNHLLPEDDRAARKIH